MVHRFISIMALGAALGIAAPAVARDLCPERPGQTTPPCTVATGELLIETGLVDLSRLRDAPHTATLTIAQTTARLGIADHGEIAVSITPFVQQGIVGIGDTAFSLKRSFGDAEDPHVAIKASVSVPTARSGLGAGGWTTTVQLPLSFDLSPHLQVAAAPQASWVIDDDGQGHHWQTGGAVGVAQQVGAMLTLNADVLVLHDHASDATTTTLGTAVAYQPSKRLQLDLGANLGLSHAQGALEVYLGIARRF